ncbi:MAG: dipeptidase [Rhodothermales bacterium]
MRLARLLFVLPLFVFGCGTDDPCADTTDEGLRACADHLAQHYIIVDGHIDIPYRLREYSEDIGEATQGGDFDYPRAKQGGLNAPFMSIYIPAANQDIPGAAPALADSLIGMVEGFAERHPNKFAVATSVADVEAHHEAELISLPMGMENGAPIEDDLSRVEEYYNKGIRYITLTHGRDNLISDSSYDTTGTHQGLSDFGKEVVREMNRVGIMVDVSHISDNAFWDVMEITEAPVIASHSSVRDGFTDGWQRNMGDDLIKRLAENEGVIMINFGSSFLRSEYQAGATPIRTQFNKYIVENNLPRRSPEAIHYLEKLRKENPVGTVDDVVAHIEHVKNLVGVDYIGLGSDFDGVTTLPAGLNDASTYPNLIYELLKKGYTEEEIVKILGGNALRVWREVERVAASS